ncbi:hypothetical protein FOA43_004533 [Brettanomyces nanus]|uniref:WD repeat-containing protein JIP5 n=1 Tax=Eeniella nana TaxID=13502 RepID=A0A875SCD0_EENNA|nr:uncharacterized protein FOA43_004533 [Brettanomyces nanus]QPG77129.1 hypothetical protein FOA43_004533 [Brettanomyces nanus]
MNLFVTGTAQGEVKLFKYDAQKLEDSVLPFNTYDSSLGLPNCTTVGVYGKEVDLDDVENDAVVMSWRTKRHKGSCRDVKFDCQGEYIYTAGSDGVIKKADVSTGKVVAKIERNDSAEAEEGVEATITRILTVPNKPFLIVGDEDGNVKCYDTNSMEKLYELKKVHGDAVNGICHCAPKSDYKFVSIGSLTLANWDIRKEKVIHKSESQDDEVLSCAWVDQDTQKTMICGMAEGIVTVWKPEYNEFEDQISRINLDKEESAESVISAMDSNDRYGYVGMSNGIVSKIDIAHGRKIEQIFHTEKDDDSVSILDLDHEYRLVSAGIDKLKLWSNKGNDDNDDAASIASSDSSSGPPNKKLKPQALPTISSHGITKFDDL